MIRSRSGLPPAFAHPSPRAPYRRRAASAALVLALAAAAGAAATDGLRATVSWPDGSRLEGLLDGIRPDGGPLVLRHPASAEPLLPVRHGAAVRFTAREGEGAAPADARILLWNGDAWSGRVTGYTADGLLLREAAAAEPVALAWADVREYDPVHPGRERLLEDWRQGTVLDPGTWLHPDRSVRPLRRGGPEGPVVTAAEILAADPDGIAALERARIHYAGAGWPDRLALDMELEGGDEAAARAHLTRVGARRTHDAALLVANGQALGHWYIQPGLPGPAPGKDTAPGPGETEEAAAPPSDTMSRPLAGTRHRWTVCADFRRGVVLWRRDGLEVARIERALPEEEGENSLVLFPQPRGRGRLLTLCLRPWRDEPGAAGSEEHPPPVLVRRRGAPPLSGDAVSGTGEGLSLQPTGGGAAQTVPWEDVVSVHRTTPPSGGAGEPAAARVITRSGSRVAIGAASLSDGRLLARTAAGDVSFDASRLFGLDAAPAEEPVPPATRITLRGGDSLEGRVGAIDDRAIRWTSPLLAGEASFHAAAVEGIAAPRRAAPPEGTALAVLADGERIPGRVVSLDGGRLVLDTPFGAAAGVPADRLLRLDVRHPDTDILFEGFGPAEAWEAEMPNPLRFECDGDVLTLAAAVEDLPVLGGVNRAFPGLPRRFRVDVVVSAPGASPCFVLHAFCPKGGRMVHGNGPGVRFVVEAGRAVVIAGEHMDRVSREQQVGLREAAGGEPLEVTLFADAPRRVYAMFINGAPAWSGPVFPTHVVEGNRLALRSLRRFPPVTFSGFRLSAWNGVLPRSGEAGSGPGAAARVELLNGDTPPGRLAGIADGKALLEMEEGAAIPLPLDRLQRVVWSDAQAAAPSADGWVLEIAGAGRLYADSVSAADAGAIAFDHPVFGRRRLPREALVGLRPPVPPEGEAAPAP